MFRYFRRIDRQINDTLKIYQDIGKLSSPLFKYLLIIISFLVFTSSLALIFSFFVDNSVSMDSNAIWINYSLPIIIYGVICPLISTLISLVFKMFLEFYIGNIINKYKYIKKKSGKPPNIIIELFKIIKFIACSRFSILIVSSFLFLFLPFDITINCILMGTFILFCVIKKLIEYYDNSVDCYITGLEKCYTNNDVFWRYNIAIKYPHEEKRIVKKRFNDFKKLHQDLDLDDSLPTNDWIKPYHMLEAEERGKKLDLYMKRILTNKDIMANSIFYSFFKEKDDMNISEVLILEKKNIEINDFIDIGADEHIEILKIQLSTIISEEIDDIFILYEVNYYMALKKRFYVICKDTLYKLKYDKFMNKFYIRLKVKFNNLYKLEKTKIMNTNYLKNTDILLINFIINGKMNYLTIKSLADGKNYSIEEFNNSLKNKLKNYSCRFIETNGCMYDNGFGISEGIQHNTVTKNVKKIINTNLIYGKSILRNIWN